MVRHHYYIQWNLNLRLLKYLTFVFNNVANTTGLQAFDIHIIIKYKISTYKLAFLTREVYVPFIFELILQAGEHEPKTKVDLTQLSSAHL